MFTTFVCSLCKQTNKKVIGFVCVRVCMFVWSVYVCEEKLLNTLTTP